MGQIRHPPHYPSIILKKMSPHVGSPCSVNFNLGGWYILWPNIMTLDNVVAILSSSPW